MDNTVYIQKATKFILNFTSILWEAMPFIVLGAVIAGILEEMLPQKLVARVLPRSRFLSILMGGLLGIVFPMCECGIIPVMRRLLRKGLPLSCCTAYLLAGPIVNVVVILSTVFAFAKMEEAELKGVSLNQMGSLWMTGCRVVIGYLVAVGTSLIVDREYQKYGNALLTPLATPSSLPLLEEKEEIEGKPISQRLSNISETTLHDFTDITVFLIFGTLMTCTVRIWLTPDDIYKFASGGAVLAILLMMALAIILCLCSEADAFVAASLVSLPAASKVAFLTLGPMMDFKLFMMYTRVFRPRLIWTIIISVVIQVFIYALLVQLFWERYGPIFMPTASPDT